MLQCLDHNNDLLNYASWNELKIYFWLIFEKKKKYFENKTAKV